MYDNGLKLFAHGTCTACDVCNVLVILNVASRRSENLKPHLYTKLVLMSLAGNTCLVSSAVLICHMTIKAPM